MNAGNGASVQPIYPKRYFDASPTWFAWNRLTIADVFALRTEQGFQGQDVYFYLNHPIQYVRLVGVVLALDMFAEGRFTVLTIDDGSGACIEVKITRRPIDSKSDVVYPSNTTIDDVNVYEDMGLPRIHFGTARIEVGTVVRVKGTITTFRENRQLDLKRATIVTNTKEEARAWADTIAWKQKHFSTPWILSKEEQDNIDEQTRLKVVKQREHESQKRSLDSKNAERKRRREEKNESRRKAKEAELNSGALSGSNVTKMPWD